MDDQNIREIEGIKFYMPDPNDYYYKEMLEHSSLYWGEDFVRVLLDAIYPGSAVVDAGAFIGRYTIPFSYKAKMVFAFEPMEKSFGLLTRNLLLNNIQNVKTFNFALSSKQEMLSSEYRSRERLNTAAVFLVPGKDIKSYRLDDVICQNHLPISVIKIAVQEMELDVLLGAEQTIKAWNPLIKLHTISPSHRNKRRFDKEKIESYLQDMGYHSFPCSFIGINEGQEGQFWFSKHNQHHSELFERRLTNG